MLKLLPTLLLLVSCGTGAAAKSGHLPSSGQVLTDVGALPTGFVDPVLGAYVDEFLEAAKDHGRAADFSILRRVEFKDDDGGDCRLYEAYGKRYGYITVHTMYRNTPQDLRTVMYHELGHCLLGLQHVADPNQIMYPWEIRKPYNEYYDQWWEAATDGLFAQPANLTLGDVE